MILFDTWFRQLAIPEKSLERIYELCKKFPLVSGVIIEKHLADAGDRTDFAIRISGDIDEKVAYSNHISSLQYSTSFQSWKYVSHFFSEWCAAGPPLLKQFIGHVWLEFDNLSGAGTINEPSLFFNVDPKGQLTFSEKQFILFEALAALSNNFTPGKKNNIARCLYHLPQNAALHYAGLMLPRNTDFVRLCLKGLTALQIITYLDLIGWSGNRHRLKNVLDKYAGNCKKIVVHVDVNEGIDPELGLEFHFDHKEDWIVFFDLLISDKIILREGARQLLAYPGYEIIPETAFKRWLLEGKEKDHPYIIRRLNHVKLGLKKTGAISVKAYLYACYHLGVPGK